MWYTPRQWPPAKKFFKTRPFCAVRYAGRKTLGLSYRVTNAVFHNPKKNFSFPVTYLGPTTPSR